MAPPATTLPPEPELTLPPEDPETTLPTSTGAGGATTDTATNTATNTAPTTVVDTTVVDAAADGTITEDGLSGGWFDDSAAIPHVIAWGMLLLAVGIGSYYVGKASKRLYVSFIVGFIPFVVVLYFFFENVNRLLPPGL